MSFAIAKGLNTQLLDNGHLLGKTNLDEVLELTIKLSEEFICAKILGKKTPDCYISTLVVVATQLRRAGVEWPKTLKYALDAPEEPKAENAVKLKKLGDLKGFVENVSAFSVVGWALNSDDPFVPVELEILVNQVVIANIIADKFRSDLLEVNIGNGNHGFEYYFTGPFVSLSRKRILVRRRTDRSTLWELTS